MSTIMKKPFKHQSHKLNFAHLHIAHFLSPELQRYLTKKQQMYFVWAAIYLHGKRYVHSDQSNAGCLFYQHRQGIFRPLRAFHEKNEILQWFILVEKHDHRGNKAAAWMLTEKGESFVRAFSEILSSPEAIEQIQALKPPKKHPTGINKLTASGSRTSFQGIKVCSENYFNVGNVQKLFQESSWDENLVLKDQCTQIMLHSFYKEGLFIPQVYTQAPSGRLYLNGTSLQNVSSSIKVAALKGCHEVDMENAHYQLFNQLCNRMGITNIYVEQYLENKVQWRESIAKEVDVSVKSVKTALIALIFGAALKFGHTLESELGRDGIEKLMQSDRIQGLAKELRRGRKLIVESHRYKDDGRKMIGGCFNGLGTFVKGTCP
jgi:hypothetical protein